MQLKKNKHFSFLIKENIIDYIFYFYLTIFIFNFDNFFRKDLISLILGSYLLLYFCFNQKIFFKIKHANYALIFLSYLIINQLYHYNTTSNTQINFISIDLLGLIFNLLLFSFLIMLKKNWTLFFEKIFFIICIFLVFIFIQNYILLDKFIVTNNIFFDYQNYEYNWASKNFIAIILNIFLIFLNLNFSKNKFYYLYFFIISFSIIFTLSRAGYYIYLINLIYFIINSKNIIIKVLSVVIFIFLTSIFWSESSKKFYIDKKSEISYLANINSIDKVTPKSEINVFSKLWFSRKSKSTRISYFFLTFENLKENYLIGSGLGSFKINNKIFNKDGTVKRYPDSHSTWLLLLYETGIIGFLMYIFLIIKNKYSLFNRKKILNFCNLFYFLLIVISCSLFINLLYTPIVWFLYAMKLSLDNEHKYN
jgi:O-antigen ligase